MTSTTTNEQWQCKRCGQDTATKSSLIRHLKRVSPCEGAGTISIEDYLKELTHKDYNEKTYDCEHCGTRFNSRSNKSRHKKTCAKAKKADEKQQKDVIILKLNTLQQQNSTLIEQNTMLTQRLCAVEERLNGSVQQSITNNNITNNNIININLNNFGSENTSYLTPEFLSYCLKNPRKGMTSLIENIHYNNDYPENHNLRCKSLKQNVFEKYVDSEWRACDASNTLDELIRKGYRIMNAHYTDNYMNDPEIQEDEVKQMAYERFRFLTDTTCNDYFAVKREVRLLIKDRTMYLVASPDNNIPQIDD